jgi:hypothetical protein
MKARKTTKRGEERRKKERERKVHKNDKLSEHYRFFPVIQHSLKMMQLSASKFFLLASKKREKSEEREKE